MFAELDPTQIMKMGIRVLSQALGPAGMGLFIRRDRELLTGKKE
jgi:hypothetical protein